MLLLALIDSALLISLVCLLLIVHRERPRDVLLGRRSPWREALAGLLLLPVVFAIVIAILLSVQRFAPWLHNVDRNPLEDLIKTPRDAVRFGLVAIIGGGFREEIQRAFILHRFERHLGGAWVGLVVFSVVFGAGHVLQGYDAAITTGVLGAIWGIIYLRRRSVIAPIVSHSGFNAAEIVRHAFYGS